MKLNTLIIQNIGLFIIIFIIFNLKNILFFNQLKINIYKKIFLCLIIFIICYYYLLNIHHMLMQSYLLFTFELAEDYTIAYKLNYWDGDVLRIIIYLISALLILYALLILQLNCIKFLFKLPNIIPISDICSYFIVFLFIYISDFILFIIISFKTLITAYNVIQFLKKFYFNEWNKIKEILFKIILSIVLLTLIIIFILNDIYTSIFLICGLISFCFIIIRCIWDEELINIFEILILFYKKK